MLELKNVSKYYNSNGVVTLGLRNINLKLGLGEIVAITGDSGSGKSTLLNVMTGVDTYEEGEILFYGNETSYFDGNDMDAFRKNNVSFIYQKYNIIDSYSVLENVMIPLELKGIAYEECKSQALEIIKRVGLIDRINHKGSKLSGGEKQRCVIARALASDSKILACDEPTGNLDSKTGEEIIKLIKEVSKDRLVLIVTHNYDQVKDIVTRRIKISDGEIVEDIRLDDKLAEDENEKMELRTAPIAKKTLARFSALNIRNTPKKSALVSLVFLGVSFIALLLSMLTLSMASYGSYYVGYNMMTENRVIAYDKDHKALDRSKLDSFNPYYNSFYEDDYFTVRYSPDQIHVPGQLYLTNYMPTGKLKFGRSPEASGEGMIIVPRDFYFLEECEDLIGGTVYYDEGISRNSNLAIVNNVTGVLISDEVKDITLYSYDRPSEDFLNSYYYTNIQIYNKEASAYAYVDTVFSDTADKFTLYLPYSYTSENYEIIYGEFYRANIKADVVIGDGSYPIPTLVIPKGEVLPTVEMEIYEASIYTDNPMKTISDLKSLGFFVTQPAKAAGKNSFDMAIINLFIGITFLALVSLFFVSYAIISRIYTSKSKDYGILRALGVVRGDLGFMVKLETMGLCLGSSLISLIVAIILKFALPKTIFGYFSLVVIPIYLVVMILFSYLLARRFNHHLFRFSLNTTLKDGDK